MRNTVSRPCISDHVGELKISMNELEKTFKDFELRMTKTARRLLPEVCGARRMSLQQESKTFLGLGGTSEETSKSQKSDPEISITQLQELMYKAHQGTSMRAQFQIQT